MSLSVSMLPGEIVELIDDSCSKALGSISVIEKSGRRVRIRFDMPQDIRVNHDRNAKKVQPLTPNKLQPKP